MEKYIQRIIDIHSRLKSKSLFLFWPKADRGLRALKEEEIFKKYIVVSRDSITRTTDDGIILLPWNLFLEWLWDGKII